MPMLFLITGSRGAGKTSFCVALVEAARSAGWKVAGLLSRPVFEGDLRIAIDAEDLSGGETRRLAVRSNAPTAGTQHWRFDESAVDWGSAVLQHSVPCDLLVVDELGPLEFTMERGWQAAFPAVDSRQYAVAVVVVRAELLAEALLRWSDAQMIEIETFEDSRRKSAALIHELFSD